jgi:type IV pilus assembly protein PilO
MILGLLDDLRERPPAQKLGALIFLVLAVFLLDYQYVWGPRQERLAELRAELDDKEADLKRKQEKTDMRAQSEKELRDLSAELRRAEARLPDQREIASLLSDVAASGRAVGLDITLFRQKPETYSDYYAEVPVQMEMRGTYHDLVMFLDRVKRLDRIVNVSDIRLDKPEVAGDRVVLTAACTATTFRFLQEAERQRIQEEKKKQGGGGKDKPKGRERRGA